MLSYRLSLLGRAACIVQAAGDASSHERPSGACPRNHARQSNTVGRSRTCVLFVAVAALVLALIGVPVAAQNDWKPRSGLPHNA